ncbi:MAG: NAD(P)-dependent oxidoreductase [Phycisphaerales bacterium]|jgi:3-hydroxyisobutyrate dehydrogenase|nr:NAD(P)-dependent oxidoreductase [Phycisphaerales bacterium]
MLPSVAFIGLGIMGLPMAGHLLEAGYPLTVNTRTKSKADDLLARGARWTDSPKSAAQQADVIFICVPDTPDVEKVILGADGIIHAARVGQIVVDHSTISPSATREMARQLAERGATLLDAPVSGGDVGAKNATLSIMVGGDPSAFNQVKPLLERMGKTITHCGGSGTGQLTKLVNQILVSITNLAVCEALTFAMKNGLVAHKTLSAVGGGAASSWQLLNLGPKMVDEDFRPGFMIDLQQKDLRLCLQAASEAGLELSALPLVHKLFNQAQADGHGRDGTQALFDAVRKRAVSDQ